MPNTTNHEYNKPAIGSNNWGEDLHENWDQFDIDIEIRDTDAAKGSYEPEDNALFRATDTGNVYLGDGNSWTKHNPPRPQLTDPEASLSVTSFDEIKWGSDLDMVDNGDGSVTINTTADAGDTRTHVSNTGGVVVTETQDITFDDSGYASVTVTDDGDQSATITYGVTSDLANTTATETVSADWTVNDDNALYFGTDNDTGVRWSGASGAMQIRDFVNNVNKMVIAPGSDPNFPGGVRSSGNAVAEEGASDASSLTGASGSNGQYLRSDGAESGWSTIDHSEIGTISSNDHHTRPTAGRGIADNSNTFDLEPHVKPNAHTPFTSIPDGSFTEIPIYLPSSNTFYLWGWGARTASQTTPAGLTVEVYDLDSAASISSANTAWTTGSPILQHSDGTVEDLGLRLNNNTGGTVTAGGTFAYTIE